MADDFSIEVKNMKDIENMFQKIGLTIKQQNEVYYKLNRKSGAIALKKLRANAPSGNNNKKPKNKVENNVVMKRAADNPNGVLIGFKRRAWYVILLEHGVNGIRKVLGRGRTKKYKGATRGTMAAQPFIQRSHDEALPTIMKELNTNYLKNINTILKSATRAVNNKIAKYTK